jgi:hypothetical protein
MGYSIGQQDVMVAGPVRDRAGQLVTGETSGVARWAYPDGSAVPGTFTVAESATLGTYEFETPTFDRAGTWWWHLAFDTPDAAADGRAVVDWSPAAPVAP